MDKSEDTLATLRAASILAALEIDIDVDEAVSIWIEYSLISFSPEQRFLMSEIIPMSFLNQFKSGSFGWLDPSNTCENSIEDVLKESTLCSTSEDAFPETVAVFSLTLPEAFNCEEVRSSSQASR